MYNIFDPKLGHGHPIPIKKVIKFNHVKQTLNHSLGDVIAYYQRANFRVEEEHLIHRLIKMLRISTARELNDYVRVAREKTPLIAKRLKLIHATNHSHASVDGTFYNKYITEYLIATDEEFNVQMAWRNWKSLAAVKVHSHPYNDLSMGLCDGSYPATPADGYAVLTINIALLALQYRAFCEEMYDTETGIGTSQIRSFIHRYVITNMLKRHVEIALINRTMCAYAELPRMPFRKIHPIYVVDYDRRTDDVVDIRTDIMLNYSMPITVLYRTFDCIWFENWLQVIKLPDMPPTRPVKWAITLNYLRYIEYYLMGLTRNNNQLDVDVRNKIIRQLKALSVARGMPPDINASAHRSLQNIDQLLISL